MSVPHCSDYCSFVQCFEIRNVDLPTFFFFFQYCFGCWESLNFHMNFMISLSISSKEQVGILMGLVLNLKINLGSLVILTILRSKHP